MTQSVEHSAGIDETVAGTVDTDRFPLTAPGSALYSELVAAVRAELAGSGCSVLRGFLRPAARDLLRAETARLATRAHPATETVNVYNTADVDALPPGHPGRRTFERGNAFVARADIPVESLLQRLYAAPPMRRFVADCVGLDEVHELTDPFSALVVNVVAPDRSHPWHFDINEFTVSLLTGEPDAGGVFEFCPDLRTPDAENLDEVTAVLDGRAPHRVRALPLRAGDLQLFRGRYALHRVTAVTGAAPRISAILAYSERPGVIGSMARTRQLFGRVSVLHRDAARGTVRVDQLLD